MWHLKLVLPHVLVFIYWDDDGMEGLLLIPDGCIGPYIMRFPIFILLSVSSTNPLDRGRAAEFQLFFYLFQAFLQIGIVPVVLTFILLNKSVFIQRKQQVPALDGNHRITVC